MAEAQASSGDRQHPDRADGPAPWRWNDVLTPRTVLQLVLLLGLVAWLYWYPLVRWEAIWNANDAWSYGYFIPVVAVLITHFRLQEKGGRPMRPCAWGLALVLGGLVLRIWPQMLRFSYPGEITFVLVVAGVVLWMLGWEMFKVLWVPVAYLWLMIPWPDRIYGRIALPAQQMAAIFTEKFLAIIGTPVLRRGNVLELESGPLQVAEACSGLRLLLAFVALGVMMAFINRRSSWQRAVIIISSVPIAVFCNFIRVTLMALSSNALHYEARRLAAGDPTWSSWMPRVVTWSSTAWVGVVLVCLAVFLLVTGGSRGAMGRLGSPLGILGLLVVGVAVVLGTADLVLGYPEPAQLQAVRETVLNPESAPHQAFGFLMLGLAFVLMWAELRIIDKLVDMLFIEDDVSPEKAASGG